MAEQSSEHHGKAFLWLGMALAALAAVAAIVALKWRRRPSEGVPTLPEALLELPPGLTEEEAAARWTEGQDNAVHLKPPRTPQQIWRENLYTIFNLSLVGLACTQLLLSQWLNALLSVGTIFLNVGINVGQEMLAMRRLAAFEQNMLPKATVMREGKARSIDPSRVVRGDVLIVGPGDQLLVDGQVVGDGQMEVSEAALTGKRAWQTKRSGDQVYAGSLCVSGRGAYVAGAVGDERLIVSNLADTQVLGEELTPLERIVDRVLRALLVLVAVFAAILLLTYFRMDVGIPAEVFNEVAGMIFGLAPAGLFLMIIVTYTTGRADLAKLGALVHQSRSVESLAEATVICFAEAGILTGTHMEMELAETPETEESMARSRLRQILGDFARSTSARNLVTQIMVDTFEGNRREVYEESPFLSAYGWSAVSFDRKDLKGVYVLGEPQTLRPNLVTDDVEPAGSQDSKSSVETVRRLVSPLGRLFRRGDGNSPDDARDRVEDTLSAEAVAGNQAEGDLPVSHVEEQTATPVVAEGGKMQEEDQGRGRLLRRWVKQARSVLRRTERTAEQPGDAEKTAGQEAVLLFAYHPEIVPLHDAEGVARLPTDLIPLCSLRYSQRLRPEAIETARAFSRTGVAIKVFTSDDPDQTLAMLQQAGLDRDPEDRLLELGIVSGRELDHLPPEQWHNTAAENAIFGHIAPEQAGALVRALRERGESVAVVGDGVADLPALQQANLAICRQTSTQAALSIADIVLLGSSPKVLLQVLNKGQRIVQGLLDVLKLNLTQVFYLALLIGAIQLLSVGYPYASAQGTAIVVITVAIPSVGLTFWALAGVVSSKDFARTLAQFVGPAALTMSLASLLAYLFFLDRTGDVAYAQLAVTYTLIYSGLLLAVFLKPPLRLRTVGGVEKGDLRMAGLALILGVAAFFLPAIPPAKRYLKMFWLQQPVDYAIVAAVVLGWALVLGLTWWLTGRPAQAAEIGAGAEV